MALYTEDIEINQDWTEIPLTNNAFITCDLRNAFVYKFGETSESKGIIHPGVDTTIAVPSTIFAKALHPYKKVSITVTK